VTERGVVRWARELGRVAGRIGPRFGRPELRVRAAVYLRGLVADVERKNGWQLAEFAGEATPANLQHFLGRARWDADAVRDDLARYVAEHLGGPDGVLIVDETGFLKKGDKSAGVGRMYSGTAGRIENCQVGVFCGYRSANGQALVDRELYLPKDWAEDRARRRAAHVPEEVEFATKPELARRMIARTLEAGLPVRWVTADEIYGSDWRFRDLLRRRGVSYVVAISCQAHLGHKGLRTRVDEHAAGFGRRMWKRLSCGPGAKGERIYEWAVISWPEVAWEDGDPERRVETGFTAGLLVRRSLKGPSEKAYYYTYAPTGTAPKSLVGVAGARWAIEECFEQAKQETGLDEYEVRTWAGWHRHVTLSMFAHAMPAVIRARARRDRRSGVTKKGASGRAPAR
jgi:SRSO17 transposase